jgi:hypothetical protein
MEKDASVQGRRLSGPCFGGPLNQLRMAVHAELGFLYVDYAQGTVWVYNWFSPGRFVAEPDQGLQITLVEGTRFGVPNEDSYAVMYAPQLPE